MAGEMSAVEKPLITGGKAHESDDFVRLTQDVFQCHRMLREAIAENVSPAGLAETEFFLLWSCSQAENSQVAQRQVTQSIGVSNAQMSGTVETLRQRKLIEVSRCEFDRRRQLVSLTREGQRELESALSNLTELSRRISKNLTSQQLNALCQLMDIVAGRQESNEKTTNERLRIFDPNADEVGSAEGHGGQTS